MRRMRSTWLPRQRVGQNLRQLDKNDMGKGSSYEREICKQLSKWWTDGSRDDVFWRSSQSGGRATQRAKHGLRTYGAYGDIAAVDPIGEPLLKLFTIELKRGRSHGCPNDLLDCRPSTVAKPFECALVQAIDASKRAQSRYWMLVSRRDGRQSMVFLPWMVRTDLPNLLSGPFAVFDLLLCSSNAPLRFVGLKLDDFLRRVSPKDICKSLKMG
jgi:hypothetical protein